MKNYTFTALVTKVIDGDTIQCVVDLPFHIKIEERFRLINVDCPEVRGSTKVAGSVAADFVKSKIENKIVSITSYKDDSFGRWLADVYYTENDISIHLNGQLLDLGLATVWGK